MVDQDDFHPRLGGDERDASPHHTRAQNAYFADLLVGDIGTHGAFFQGFFVYEQRADHRA